MQMRRAVYVLVVEQPHFSASFRMLKITVREKKMENKRQQANRSISSANFCPATKNRILHVPEEAWGRVADAMLWPQT